MSYMPYYIQHPRTRHYLVLAHSLRRRLCDIEDTESGAQGTTAPGSLRDIHDDRTARALDLTLLHLPDTWN